MRSPRGGRHGYVCFPFPPSLLPLFFVSFFLFCPSSISRFNCNRSTWVISAASRATLTKQIAAWRKKFRFSRIHISRSAIFALYNLYFVQEINVWKFIFLPNNFRGNYCLYPSARCARRIRKASREIRDGFANKTALCRLNYPYLCKACAYNARNKAIKRLA